MITSYLEVPEGSKFRFEHNLIYACECQKINDHEFIYWDNDVFPYQEEFDEDQELDYFGIHVMEYYPEFGGCRVLTKSKPSKAMEILSSCPGAEKLALSDFLKEHFDSKYVEEWHQNWKMSHPQFVYNHDMSELICDCGHPYHRHFDSYEDNRLAGCKYCGCYEFMEKL